MKKVPVLASFFRVRIGGKSRPFKLGITNLNKQDFTTTYVIT